jgi:hypothetical protein
MNVSPTILRRPYTTPGADTNTYVLFATVAVTGTGQSWPDPGWGKGILSGLGLKRLILSLKHSGDVTLNWYSSSDRGANWHQLDTDVVTAPVATDVTVRDLLIEEYDDFKLELVNGGAAQTTYNVQLALTNERSAMT